MSVGRPIRILLLISVCWVLTPLGMAQRSRLAGRVIDGTGAAVPGSEIIISSEETGLVRSGRTGVRGYYAIPLLPSGSYRLTVLTEGFRPISRSGIRIQVGETVRLDFRLSVQALRERIEVPAENSFVETYNAAPRTVIDSRRVSQLPLNGRNPVELQYLVSGVGRRTAVGQAQNRGVSINGGRPNTNNYTLDGGDNHDPYFNTPAVFPSPDALREFNIRVGAYGAEGGRNSGVQMNAVTRSGTNDLHGVIFEFLRNTKLNARNFFANGAPPFKRHQFGGAVGGPIRQNRTFYFVSYQGTISRSSPSAKTATMLTAAERQGDFSARAEPLADPLGGFFPGNRIPARRLHSAATAFLDAFIPLPNRPDGLYTYASRQSFDEHQWIGKLDHQVTEINQLTGRLMYNGRRRREAPGNVPDFFAEIDYTTWNLAVSDTHVVSTNLIHRVTFSMTRINREQQSIVPGGIGWSDLGAGFTRAFDGDAPVAHDTVVDGYFRAFSRFPLDHRRSNIQLSDSVTLQAGSHMLKLGGDLRFSRLDLREFFRGDPRVRFRNHFTGDAAADLLLGRPQRASQIAPTSNRPRAKEIALYVQDDWKATPRLALNLGFRWEPFFPYTDLDDRFAQIRPGGQSTLFPTAPAGLLFAGDPGVPRATIRNLWSNLAPRVGFAFDPFGSGRTSIRGGYGLFFSQVRQQAHNQISTNQPFSLKLNIEEPTGGLDDPYSETGNPFPFTPPATAAERRSYRFLTPVAVTQWNPDFRTAIVQNWNLSLQREVWRGQVVTFSYVGSKGNHLFLSNQANPAVYGAPGETIDERRAWYPDYGSVQVGISDGNSIYHAFQASFERRFRSGVSVLASYTFSKLLDNASSDGDVPSNPYDLANEKAHSDFDLTHRMVASFVWDLPAPTGGGLLPRRLLSGWGINGVITLESGRWLTIWSGQDNSGSGVGADRADLVGDPRLPAGRPRGERIARFFNTAAFAPNPAGTFGTSGRNIVEGPGVASVDLGLRKSIAIREQRRVEFRAEFFNALNRVNLDDPNTNRGSALFGRITSAGAPRVVQLALRYVF